MSQEIYPVLVAAATSFVPSIYQDLIQPSVKEVGEITTRTVRIALTPLKALLWSFEKLEEFIIAEVAERLKGVPAEDIVKPALNVVGPAFEALRFTENASELRELYANLLAASMYSKTKSGAHPAFVEIIKQLTPDEARLIRLFATPRSFPLLTVRYDWIENKSPKIGGENILVHFSHFGIDAHLECPDMTPTFVNNICRLGLGEIPAMQIYVSEGIYEPLENSLEVQSAKKEIEENPELRCSLTREGFWLTEFGKQFIKTCVLPQFPSQSIRKLTLKR